MSTFSLLISATLITYIAFLWSANKYDRRMHDSLKCLRTGVEYIAHKEDLSGLQEFVTNHLKEHNREVEPWRWASVGLAITSIALIIATIFSFPKG